MKLSALITQKIFFLCLSLLLVSFPDLMAAGFKHDLKIEIHENAINNFLKAFGAIQGNKEINSFFYNGRLNWRVYNIHVSLKPQGGYFSAGARVAMGPFSYSPKLRGKIKVSYNPKTNKIIVVPEKALIEIYFLANNKKIHLGYLNIARFLRLDFDGPKGATSGIKIRMPNGRMKKIYSIPENYSIQFFEERIIFFSDLRYINHGDK